MSVHRIQPREEAVAAFYAAQRVHLERLVAHRAKRASRATVEDACQIAWTRLMRRPDVELSERGLTWLLVVATREAWNLSDPSREVPAGGMLAGRHDDSGVLPEPAGPASDPLELAISRTEYEERALAFRSIKPRERRELYLHALGYTYSEIATLTGSTYTAVNRYITEGRVRLRRHVAAQASQRRPAAPAAE